MRAKQWIAILGWFVIATSLSAADEPASNDKLVPRFAFRDEATGAYGFLTRDGKIAIEPKYRHAIDFVDGLARVCNRKQMSFIDEDGEIQFRLPNSADTTMQGSEGRIWFQSDAKWGFVDKQGRLILKPTYQNAFPFREGLARVNLGAEWRFPGIMEGGKWGFVDTTGKLAIPLQYERAGDFHEGLAKVSDGAGSPFIDKQGRVVFHAKRSGNFREGLCPIYLDRSLKGMDWLTRYVDRSGETQFEVDGYGEQFHEGFAVISRRDMRRDFEDSAAKESGCGYINRQGELVIPTKFVDADPFSEGLAAVCRRRESDGSNESWGYIDETGGFVIWPQFNETSRFDDGVAKVHVGGTFAIVDDAPGWWVGGEWILIDRTGKKLARLWKSAAERRSLILHRRPESDASPVP